MSTTLRAVAIVPVRLGSQRLPGKAMLAESGKPLFLHTYERAAAARHLDRVIVATDSAEVAAAAAAAGAAVVMTSPVAPTGSERCAEAARAIDARVVIDVQGDWPEVAPRDLDRLVEAVEAGAPCATLAAPLSRDRADDPNVVKVVRGRNARALYFSRAAIPYVKDDVGVARLRHIGVYAFARAVLLRVPDLPSSGLAETESLEQLRFLENDISIAVVMASNEPWGIETAADYDAFLQRIAAAKTVSP